ncbi:MAG: oligosaccharide flippase family protein, partial [Acidimicrobiia bacterium]|nr:oligosaccharide flippase family protein [Acidimicrobiia bacterium]
SLTSRIPSSHLIRSLRFRRVAIVNISGSVMHGVVAISLAIAGFGALAVVVGHIVRSAVILFGSLLASGVRPRLEFEIGVVRDETSFSLGVLGADVVSYANKNADYWFVGNRLGTAQLGIYYVAYLIPSLLRWRITIIAQDVLYPVVSKIRSDTPRIVSAYVRVVRLAAFLVFPTVLGLAAVADLVIEIGFGRGWSSAVEPLRVIAVAAAVLSISATAHPIFPALGRPAVLIRTGLVSLVALVAGLSMSYEHGSLVGVAWAVFAASVAGLFYLQAHLKRLIGFPIRSLIRSIGPYLASAASMSVLVFLVRRYLIWDTTPILEAALAVFLGVTLYVSIGRLGFWSAFKPQFASIKDLFSKGSP